MIMRAALALTLVPIALGGCASSGGTQISSGFSDQDQTYVYHSGAFTPASHYAENEPAQPSSWTATAAQAPTASATTEYVYRGGRDPKTGRAKTSL